MAQENRVKQCKTVRPINSQGAKVRAEHSNKNRINQTKARLNKQVLSCFLNVSTVSTLRRFHGKGFQSVGANTSKAQSPLVFSLVRRTVHKPWSVDLKVLLVL